MGREKIYIVGCGPGAKDMLTLRAHSIIERATVCVGAERLIEEFRIDRKDRRVLVLKANYSHVLKEAEKLWKAGERVVFLVSGDPLLYSFGTIVVERFGRDSCEVIPGISSVQYAFAQLKEGWHRYMVVSLHGRKGVDVRRLFEEGRELAILLDSEHNLGFLRKELEGVELKGYRFHIATNLSLPDERVEEITPEEFDRLDTPSLSILIAGRKGNG